MPTDHRRELAKVRSFTQLVAYLRDEMGWPIARDSFDSVDDLFFDFTPEELGIDTKNAAKILEIKRLRPLSTNQPWGIFFVKFEPKQLPVVALRRILSQVALKKRSSANSAERAAWSADDLLFVSNYGEGETRRISFAHFSQNTEKKDLPTLKVLGWNNLDTALHLDDVSEKLTQRLVWPDDDEDVEKWRKMWRSAFTLEHREAINTSKKLSVELAKLARNIRDRINTVLAIETDKGPVTKLMAAFKKSLVHDLDEDGFADMYAQTIAYGLLSARVSNPTSSTVDDFAAAMPVTNPFLKELMETFLHVGGRKGRASSGVGIDFDELGVGDVVELLDTANMEAVVRDFGDRNPAEDPVIHFYEGFAKEYDPIEKAKRGEFYTPLPVVSYMVRSIDEILRIKFGLEDGLADTATWGEMAKRSIGIDIPDGVDPDQSFIQILDPATGTGTFLVEIIELIRKTMIGKWKEQGRSASRIVELWNDYVPKHLLPRLHAFELKMAPYAIAHLKVGLKLFETGYAFGSNERARVYLTNTLEQASDTGQKVLEGFLPALAHETRAVNAIKRTQHFTVVIGNPPYSSLSSNLGEEQRHLIDAYRFVDGEKIKERGALQLEKNLQDDYVKFIRVAQTYCEQSSASVMGFITNHTYIDNPTLRGVRASLMETFDSLWILDLHGNTKKKERCPFPEPDRNVFDIQQGVAILLGARSPRHQTCEIQWGELWGSREQKYLAFNDSRFSDLSGTSASPTSPLYIFAAQDEELREEFEQGVPLDEIFLTYSTGVATARDALTVNFSLEGLRSTVREFAGLGVEEARERFGLRKDTNDWKIDLAKRDLDRVELREECERPYQYRPFDRRYTYYTGKPRGFLCNPRWPVMQHIIAGRNIALCSVKAIETGHEFGHAFVTREVADHHCVSLKEVNYIFPLYVYSSNQESADSRQKGLFSIRGNEPRLNLTPEFRSLLCRRLGRFGQDILAALGEQESGTDDILAYLYSILYSPIYRARYAEFLRKGFPRICIPRNAAFFSRLVHLGRELVSLHLLESPILDDAITYYSGPTDPEIGRVGWSNDTVWLDAGKTNARKGHQATTPGTIGFRGVSKEIWDFHIGGYQVCHKWLKDRKGRQLSNADISHYQKIIVALGETTRLMHEIDEVIEAYGGWPGAFHHEAAYSPDSSSTNQRELRKAAEITEEYEPEDN